MLVTVTNLDGTTTPYGYAPEHEFTAIKFYNELLAKFEIRGFTVRDNSGNLVAKGGTL
jgi:hypothetical protein